LCELPPHLWTLGSSCGHGDVLGSLGSSNQTGRENGKNLSCVGRTRCGGERVALGRSTSVHGPPELGYNVSLGSLDSVQSQETLAPASPSTSDSVEDWLLTACNGDREIGVVEPALDCLSCFEPSSFSKVEDRLPSFLREVNVFCSDRVCGQVVGPILSVLSSGTTSRG